MSTDSAVFFQVIRVPNIQTQTDHGTHRKTSLGTKNRRQKIRKKLTLGHPKCLCLKSEQIAHIFFKIFYVIYKANVLARIHLVVIE